MKNAARMKLHLIYRLFYKRTEHLKLSFPTHATFLPQLNLPRYPPVKLYCFLTGGVAHPSLLLINRSVATVGGTFLLCTFQLVMAVR